MIQIGVGGHLLRVFIKQISIEIHESVWSGDIFCEYENWWYAHSDQVSCDLMRYNKRVRGGTEDKCHVTTFFFIFAGLRAENRVIQQKILKRHRLGWRFRWWFGVIKEPPSQNFSPLVPQGGQIWAQKGPKIAIFSIFSKIYCTSRSHPKSIRMLSFFFLKYQYLSKKFSKSFPNRFFLASINAKSVLLKNLLF